MNIQGGPVVIGTSCEAVGCQAAGSALECALWATLEGPGGHPVWRGRIERNKSQISAQAGGAHVVAERLA